jgi:solute carrier family 25 carnitine/acylcarnitine transporter 20/29
MARGIWSHEGPMAFYKGTTSPLVGVSLIVSIQFAMNEIMKRFF